ncbi:recombinase family protein [Desmonostoc muscorum CCALA 125]|nr:recombinase family protein [Desmonostoc muscorum CCALA 125]
MTTSELVTLQHLNRKAIIYIRQSTPHQLISNQESLRLQYALRQRAIELGWSDSNIEVIDSDLGTTAATAEQRPGFKEMLAQVTLGLVGIILSYDVTRLSRNCSDWYPLLDLCGYKNCLIADRDGVYNPGSANGRLLLGLKGQISEVELYTIRARLTAGIINKAQRGELGLALPVGLVRDELGIVSKDPNREIQDRIDLIFQSFLRLRSACKVLRMLNDQNLLIPRRDRFGDIIWRKPSIAAIISMLKNPAYAGAFVYGRTQAVQSGLAPHKSQQQQLPMAEWKIRVNDKYPAYINWETYERIQAQLLDNYAEYDRNKTRGIPRQGSALLHGVVYCGECGHKMVVQYKGATRYICNYLRQQYGVPVCQYIPADPIDEYVVKAFFDAMKAVEIDAYQKAVKTQKETSDAIERAHCQQIERLRYQVALAQRQFNRVDPDNRLVAAELEQRWENSLRELKLAEAAYAKLEADKSPTNLPAELKTALSAIGDRLPELWQDDILTRAHKKALLRCLIDKVVIHRIVRDQVRTRIIWRGGDTTTIDLPIPVGSLAELTNADELENQVVALSTEGIDDQVIAQQLTAQGHRSPLCKTLLPSTVKNIRLKHRIFHDRGQSHPRKISGYLTIPQVATALELPPHWIYDRVHKGTIAISKDESTGLYLFPDLPDK